MRFLHTGGAPGATTSASCQDDWCPRSSRTLRDARGFSRSSCSSASSSGGERDVAPVTPAVTPQRWPCASGARRVTLALTDAPRDVLARHADTKLHVEAAGGHHQQCSETGPVPTVVSP